MRGQGVKVASLTMGDYGIQTESIPCTRGWPSGASLHLLSSAKVTQKNFLENPEFRKEKEIEEKKCPGRRKSRQIDIARTHTYIGRRLCV